MLNKDYKDILSALLEQEADFALIGAYAMATYGIVRATMDIDLWIRATPQNASRVYQALAAFGAPVKETSILDFSSPHMVFQIGVAPRRIDILTSISGVSYDEAEREFSNIDVDGLSIKVLSVRHLIKTKNATGRNKDLADVELLETLLL